MQVLTSFILAAFVGYVGAWYFGMVEGNFALLLFLATVVTGVYWLAERYYFLPQRRQAATLLVAEAVRRRGELGKLGINQVDDNVTAAQSRLLAQPRLLDTCVVRQFDEHGLGRRINRRQCRLGPGSTHRQRERGDNKKAS